MPHLLLLEFLEVLDSEELDLEELDSEVPDLALESAEVSEALDFPVDLEMAAVLMEVDLMESAEDLMEVL